MDVIESYKTIRHIIEKEAQAILSIPITNDYDYIVEKITGWQDNVDLVDYQIVTTGMGKAGQVAKHFATTLCSTGTPAVYLHPSEAQHGDLGVVERYTYLFAFSNSGKTREIIELVELMKKLNNVFLIVITSNPRSPLVEMANGRLVTGNPDEVCPLGLTPTTSITVMSVICDILVVLLMNAKGITKEDYAIRHHGGYLGQKARGNVTK